jgi:hypothetical protein
MGDARACFFPENALNRSVAAIGWREAWPISLRRCDSSQSRLDERPVRWR